MEYRIFDSVKKQYLDKNLYYIKQDGSLWKYGYPIPNRVDNSDNRYEVKILDEKKMLRM